VTAPDGATVETTYSGNQVTVKDPANMKRRSVTDALGRLAQVIEDPDGVAYQTDYSYDTLGNLTVVNQGGQYRYFFYDSLGRLMRAKNPEQSANSSLNLTNPPAYNNNWSIAYSYDANGNLTERKDARGVVTGYSYDALNRNTVTHYNINGSQTRSVERVYDGAANGRGRLRYEQTKEGGVNATQTAIDSYDALGRALNKQQSFWRGSDWGTPYVTQQTYDLAGAVKTLTYPSGRTVNFNYDQAGRLNSFTGNLGDGVNRNYVTGIQYDAAGSMKREQFGTTIPLYHRRHYNNRGQLFDIRLGTDPNPAYDSDDLNAWAGAAGSWNRGALRLYYSTLYGCYIYGNGGTDNNGNLLRMDHQIPLDDAVSNFAASIDRYDYDSLNRLKSVTELSYTKGPSGNDVYQGIFRQAFLYDPWGNRTIDQANTVGAVNKKAYTVDTATNRLTSVDGMTMSYDAAGNQTNDGSGQRKYDGENRMVEAYNAAGVMVSWYVYDAAGRRVARTVGSQGTWQVYGMGGELLAEYPVGASPSAAQKEYGYRDGELLVVWDGSETGDRQLQWLVQDHLGSTRMVVDRSGSLGGVRRHDFAPFGEELFAGVGIRNASIGYGVDSVREKFTGYEHDDETDLDFAEARYYSAKQGRFTSTDPLHSSAVLSEPQSWNRYAYVGNRPTVITDPSGLRWAYKVDKDGVTHFAWFNTDEEAVKKGWTVIHGNYFYVGSNGHLIGLYETGGGRDFGPPVRRVQERLSVFRDTELTNTMVGLLIKSWMFGFGLGVGAGTTLSTITAEDILPLSVQIGAAMGGIGDEESGGTILATTPSGSTGAPEMLKLSDLTPTEVVNNNAHTRDVIADIKANGIKEALNYVEFNGTKYIVDGNHRYLGAHYLRYKEVPAQRVNLPYKGFKTESDLTGVPMNRFLRSLRWMKIR
jgi:RHS repeat-associated protein